MEMNTRLQVDQTRTVKMAIRRKCLGVLCKIIFLPLLCNNKSAEGCFGGKKELDKDICKTYPDGAHHCAGHTFLGRKEGHGIAVKLFNNDRKNENVEQKNFFIFPIEISRTISTLIQAADNSEAHEPTLHQIRCFIRKYTKLLLGSILVKNKEQFYGPNQDKDEAATVQNPFKQVPKMLTLDRKIFVDKKLTASQNFTQKAYCWYNMPVQMEDFSQVKGTMDHLNYWANRKNTESRAALFLDSKEAQAGERRPILTTPVNLKLGKVIVVSSLYLKLSWASKMFSTKNTIMDQSFMTYTLTDDPGFSEKSIFLPMMTTTTKVAYLDNAKYTCVSLALHENTNAGNFIIVLPKEKASLKDVEDELLASGPKLHAFMENLHTSAPKMARVQLPRMIVQITHEWSSPSNRSIKAITNSTGFGLTGDDVSVFQDAVLDLTENWNEKTNFENLKAEINFTVNRPFFFIVEMDHDVLAVGRIKDPNWCKFCNSAAANSNMTKAVSTAATASATTAATASAKTFSTSIGFLATAINTTNTTTTAAPGFFAKLFG